MQIRNSSTTKTKRTGIVLTSIGSVLLPLGVYIAIWPLLLAAEAVSKTGNIWSSGVIFFLIFSVPLGLGLAIPGAIQMIVGVMYSLKKPYPVGTENEVQKIKILREKAYSLVIVAASLLFTVSLITQIISYGAIRSTDGGFVLLGMFTIALTAVIFSLYFAFSSKDEILMLSTVLAVIVLVIVGFIQVQHALQSIEFLGQ